MCPCRGVGAGTDQKVEVPRATTKSFVRWRSNCGRIRMSGSWFLPSLQRATQEGDVIYNPRTRKRERQSRHDDSGR